MADHTSGSATYSEDQRRRVIAFLDQHRGPDNWTTTEEIERECQVKRRARRALLSELDGTLVDGWWLVLAYSDDGGRLWVATDPNQARPATHRIRSQARQENLRCDRREQAYRFLTPTPQGVLL